MCSSKNPFLFQPLPHEGNWSWCSKEENGLADKRFRFTLTSLSNPRRCVGFARRRVGRGGRIILDRISTDYDDFWRKLDFSITEPGNESYNQGESHQIGETTSSIVQQTDIKSEFSVSHADSGSIRTSDSASVDSFNFEIKKEPVDVQEEGVAPLEPVPSKEDKDEMVEFLRSLRRDWYVTTMKSFF